MVRNSPTLPGGGGDVLMGPIVIVSSKTLRPVWRYKEDWKQQTTDSSKDNFDAFLEEIYLGRPGTSHFDCPHVSKGFWFGRIPRRAYVPSNSLGDFTLTGKSARQPDAREESLGCSYQNSALGEAALSGIGGGGWFGGFPPQKWKSGFLNETNSKVYNAASLHEVAQDMIYDDMMMYDAPF